MGNIKVGVRLAVAFGVLLALMVVAVGIALLGVRGAADQASSLERDNVTLLNVATALRAAQLNEAVAIRDFVGQTDVDRQRTALQALTTSEKEYAEGVTRLEGLAGNVKDEGRRIAALVARLKSASGPISAKLREAMDQSEQAEYVRAQGIVFNEIRPLQQALAADLQALVAASNALARERAEAGRTAASRTETGLLAVLALALALGATATLQITRGVAGPLGSAVALAERVADGDLAPASIRARSDETGRVLVALGHMQERLNALVRAIRESAHAVGDSSGRIATGNTELAARTEQQAASLEETAASCEELTAIVKQNSDNAGQASQLARQAAQLAEDSGNAVAGVVRSMQDIHKSSRSVSDIVSVMDEIAFQTNLLALNAAVEAARAGEHGRGFAVVAQQVRVLAQRSAEASRDIKKLVGSAVGEADQGARMATRAGEAMAKVVGVAREVAQLVSDIARGSDEQRAGIEQVNATIAQMDTATQSNAALVQEINGLTEVLVAQAGELQEATQRFRLGGGQQGDDAGAALPAEQPAYLLA